MSKKAASTETASDPTALCGCGSPASEDSHSCPYAEEIGGNCDQEYCRCCHDCEQQCALDI